MSKIDTDPKRIDELLTRGVVEVIDREHLRTALLSGKQLRVKLGIDPTSPNIHIGRAVLLHKLRVFQEMGHKVVLIIGDATGVIGDTSDKDAERPMLAKEDIKRNLKTYLAQAFKILNKSKTETHFNSKWLKKIDIDEWGRMADLFSLHELEARENIAKRMKAGKRVSLREMFYPLMQGYDSVAVKSDIEVGGTDQKFNLLSGREIQRAYGMGSQDILMTEILLGTDGRKMSSSWGNVINLTDSANDMFGKVMSIKDELIEKYFILATNVSRETIPSILAKGPRDAKMDLATEIAKLYHGEKVAHQAREHFLNVFSRKELHNTELSEFKARNKEQSVLDLISSQQDAKLPSLRSKTELKRLVSEGAVEINGVVKKDFWEVVKPIEGETLKIGRNVFRIKLI